MSEYYDDDGDYDEGTIEEEIEGDIEIEDYTASGDEAADIYEDREVKMMAPRIMAGEEEKRHWHAESGYGLLSTTAEGALGKKLRKGALAARTDEERFRDNIYKVTREAEIPRADADAVMRLIPKIPDIRYKSPAGMLFGMMALKFLGRKLNKTEQREFDKILSLVKKVKEKNLRISDLDVIRYARLIKRIINVQK